MKKSLHLLYIFLIFLSCSKENETTTADESNNPNYKLVELFQNNIITKFEYENESLIRVVSNTNSGNTALITYEYENNFLTKVEHYINGGLEFHHEFMYENGVIKRKDVVVNEVITSYELFTMVGDKVSMIERYEKLENQNEFYLKNSIEFIYNQSENIEKQISKVITPNLQTTEIVFEFDSKKNYLSAIPKEAHINWVESSGTNQNNILSQKWIFEGNEYEHKTFNYLYSEFGYPVERNEVNKDGIIIQTTTFVYE